MTITTTQQINPAVLQAELDALASGSAFTSRGAPLDTIADKTIEAHGATDAQLQQAITTAAGKFFDRAANVSSITAAVTSNLATIETWLAANPNGAILTAADTAYLARTICGLARLLLDLTSTVGQAT